MSFAPFLFGMQGFQEGNQQPLQPEKVGWVRKFCGKGIFREIWKNRFVVLKGDQLYISEKEVGKRLLTSHFFSQAFPFLSPPTWHCIGGRGLNYVILSLRFCSFSRWLVKKEVEMEERDERPSAGLHFPVGGTAFSLPLKA